VPGRILELTYYFHFYEIGFGWRYAKVKKMKFGIRVGFFLWNFLRMDQLKIIAIL
jgi:hypothetical protein